MAGWPQRGKAGAGAGWEVYKNTVQNKSGWKVGYLTHNKCWAGSVWEGRKLTTTTLGWEQGNGLASRIVQQMLGNKNRPVGLGWGMPLEGLVWGGAAWAIMGCCRWGGVGLSCHTQGWG